MKTNNRVEKVIAGSFIVIFSLVLFGLNGYAQNYFEKESDNNLNPIACAIIDDNNSNPELVNVDKTIKNNKVEFFTEVESEKALELESWMVDEKIFDLHFFAIDVEEPLELEDWMKSENFFIVETLDILAENEESLKLENWMIEKEIWE